MALFMTLATVLTLAACNDKDAPLQVGPSVEVLGQDTPVSVTTSPIVETENGFEHEVRIAWHGEQTVRLDDTRFAHHIESADGDLITVGRGCGANWDEEAEELLLACTADLQLIFVEPGGEHAYRVVIPREVGPLRLTPGEYVVDENIHWWQQDEIAAEPTEEGAFTVRLTYEVK
jgi:hypothetical protein